MIIGVQFLARTLGALFGEGLKRVDLCVTDQFDGYVVDHIDIDPMTSFGSGSAFVAQIPVNGIPTTHLVPTHAVAYSQAVTVHLVTVSDLEANGDQPTPTLALPLTVTFDLRFDVSGSGTALTLSYQSVSSLVSDPRIAALDPVLRNHLPPQTEALDLVSLVSALGVTGSPVVAGAAVSGDGSLVEFRLELSAVAASGNLVSWEGFFTGGPDPDFTKSHDWAVWVSVDGLESSMKKLFTDGLKANSASFSLVSEVDVAWQPGEPPSLVVTFNGNAIGACTCFWSKIDVNVDVTITITFSIDSGQIRYDIHIDHSSNDLELFCCEITSALFWPFVGAVMLADKDIDVGEYVGGWLAGPLGVFIAAVVAASTQSTQIPTSSLQGTCTKDDDSHLHCLVPFPSGATPTPPCGPPSIEDRTPSELYGTPAGVVLPGALVIAGEDPIRTASQATLKCAVNDFVWQFPAPTCSGIEGELTMAASVVLSGTGDLPILFCSAVAIGDNAADYQPLVTVTYSYCPMVITVHVDVPVGTPLNGPCELLVQTTGGARVLTLHPAPALTPNEVAAFDKAVLAWRLDHCYTLLDPWYRLFHRFNPKWLVDPPSEGIDPERVSHVWEVAIAGAIHGDTVALTGLGGEQLDAAVVDAAGVARLSAVTPPLMLGAGDAPVGLVSAATGEATAGASTPRTAAGSGAGAAAELSIHRLRSGAATTSGEPFAIQMMIKQILVVEQAQLLIGRRPVALSLVSEGGQRMLLAAFSGGVNTYELSNAAAPRLIGQQMGDVHGARRLSGNRLVTWDDRGINAVDARGVRRVLELDGVRDVRAGGGGRCWAATDSHVHVLEEDWRVSDRFEVGGDQEDPALAIPSAPTSSVRAPFGESAHSRFGLVARIDTDRISLGVIAGTRTL